jgi:class 3 adenylate cyclase/tetratricopeptide (TPR) repeat protein
MADIFISYSKGFQPQTEQLANELRAKGFSVWFDTSLVPGDNFREVITSELAQARAVIVIWNESSVKSDWVCSEASRARARRILIPVRANNIRSHDIPPPFDGLHTELLSNRAAIEAALAKLGITPTLAPKNVGPRQNSDTPELATVVDRPPPGRAAPERRHLTILACERMAANEPAGRLDPEEQQEVRARFHASCATQIERFGGMIADYPGDAVVAYFGYPSARENDAERAVRAGMAILGEVATTGPASGASHQAHIGIASGLVVLADATGGGAGSRKVAIGDAATLASLLQSVADPGAMVISPETHRLVGTLFEYRDLGQQSLRGFAQPMHLRQVLGESETGHRFEALRSGHAPLVGRRLEVDQLRAALEACGTRGRGSAIYIRGEAGIGKTRLREELLAMARQQGFLCHTGLVLEFGAGTGRDAIRSLAQDIVGVNSKSGPETARAAVENALRDGLGITDDAPFLYDLLDVPQPADLRAIYDAMDSATRDAGKRRTIARLAEAASRKQARVLTVEDLHWADPFTLSHLAALVAVVPNSPIVLLITSRLDEDPLDRAWRAQAGRTPLITIDLGPLADDEAAVLASSFLGENSDLIKACVERATGNPLFLEQLSRNAAEDAGSSVPSAVQSIVQARLDRMHPQDKLSLQAASVLGQRIDPAVLAHLLEGQPGAPERLLATLMVHREGDELVFSHALIREAIYDSMHKAHRRDLHRGAAQWFASHDRALRAQHLDRAEDPLAVQAYLEGAQYEAARYRYDAAGRLAERGRALARDQADRFVLARLHGDILQDIGDLPGALKAYEMALVAATSDTERCRAWIGCAQVKRVTDDIDGAFADLASAEEVAVHLALKAEEAQVRFVRGNLLFPRGDIDGCFREHAHSLELAREAGTAEHEAAALGGLGDAEYMRGRMISAAKRLNDCVELSRRQGFGRIEVANRPMAAFTRWFAGDADAALADSRAAIEAARQVGHKRAEMIAHHAAYFCLHDLAELDGAMEHATQSLVIAQQLCAPRFEAEGLAFQAELDRLTGRREAAQGRIETALAMSRRTGMAYIGPIILGTMALLSDDDRRRRELLDEADALLTTGAVSHNHLLYGRDAIEVSLDMGDWALAEHYTSRLEADTRAEPLPFSDFFIARGRALAAAGRNPRGGDHRERLGRLMHDAERLRYFVAVPALRKALASVEGDE